jgi:hypothetical protein
MEVGEIPYHGSRIPTVRSTLRPMPYLMHIIGSGSLFDSGHVGADTCRKKCGFIGKCMASMGSGATGWINHVTFGIYRDGLTIIRTSYDKGCEM